MSPDYYASGVNVLVVKYAALKSWEQLKGQKICAIQGAWYNKEIAEKYGAEIVAFKAARPRPRSPPSAAGQLHRPRL